MNLHDASKLCQRTIGDVHKILADAPPEQFDQAADRAIFRLQEAAGVAKAALVTHRATRAARTPVAKGITQPAARADSPAARTESLRAAAWRKLLALADERTAQTGVSRREAIGLVLAEDAELAATIESKPGHVDRARVLVDEGAMSKRQIAWAELQRLGDAEHRLDPDLTREQAVTKAMRTDRGRELLSMYRASDAHETALEICADAVSKTAEDNARWPAWGCVSAWDFVQARAAEIDKAAPTSAYSLVRRLFPHEFEQARHRD